MKKLTVMLVTAALLIGIAAVWLLANKAAENIAYRVEAEIRG